MASGTEYSLASSRTRHELMDYSPFSSSEAPSFVSDRRNSWGMKRKTSYDLDYDDDFAKRRRPKYDDSGSLSPYSRRHVYDYQLPSDRPAKRPKATVEDKKRGKRLFGGLLSTLSQPNVNPQQRRRQEIENRRKDKTRTQIEKADQQKRRKLAELDEVRMAEQIDFKEKVMQNKHAKSQWAAKHLKTKSEPHIYYLPWKPLQHQEETIDKQMNDARASVARDCETFLARRRVHEDKWPSHRRLSPPPRDEMWMPAIDAKAAEEHQDPPKPEASDDSKSKAETERVLDDAHDVVMETNEDTVIF